MARCYLEAPELIQAIYECGAFPNNVPRVDFNFIEPS
jgi:hypothetical protein